MPQVDWSFANGACSHTPTHPSWETADGTSIAVCQMSGSHLDNAFRYMERHLTEGRPFEESFGMSIGWVEDWLDTFDREKARRFRLKVKER